LIAVVAPAHIIAVVLFLINSIDRYTKQCATDFNYSIVDVVDGATMGVKG